MALLGDTDRTRAADGDHREVVAHRGPLAYADEQPRSRGRRTSGRSCGVWRHGTSGARLGQLRPLSSQRWPLEVDQTLSVQSGKPVASSARTKTWRACLIGHIDLVPHWATWEHFNELDRKGLMMFGQMTAGSWIYYRQSGNRPGHL